jgi:hypothetical protein
MKAPREPSKKRSANPSGPAALVAWLFAPPGRAISIPIMLFALVCLGGYVLWHRLEGTITSAPEYRVTRESFVLLNLPPWIHSDIAGEVLHQMDLDGAVSLLDDDLTARITKAFELHPWVARVLRVEKRYPAQVIVHAEYRRPVCMVEVPADAADEEPAAPSASTTTGALGLYPVDISGVLLPTADFSRAEAARYPRLSGIESLPIGPVGTNWGDPRVTGGAEIAAVLASDWENLRLERIIPSRQPQSGGSSDDFSYELVARDGSRVIWGQRPGSRLAGEVSPAEKLERLRKVLTTAPGQEAAPLDLDIRYPSGVIAGPRTASRP